MMNSTCTYVRFEQIKIQKELQNNSNKFEGIYLGRYFFCENSIGKNECVLSVIRLFDAWGNFQVLSIVHFFSVNPRSSSFVNCLKNGDQMYPTIKMY